MDTITYGLSAETMQEWEQIIAQATSDLDLPVIKVREWAAYTVHESALLPAFKAVMAALEAAKYAHGKRVRLLISNDRQALPKAVRVSYAGSFRNVFETIAAILQAAGAEVSHQYTPKATKWGVFPIHHPEDEGRIIGARLSAPALPWARVIGSDAMNRIACWWKAALEGKSWKAIREAEAAALATEAAEAAETAEAEAEAEAEAAEA